MEVEELGGLQAQYKNGGKCLGYSVFGFVSIGKSLSTDEECLYLSPKL